MRQIVFIPPVFEFFVEVHRRHKYPVGHHRAHKNQPTLTG